MKEIKLNKDDVLLVKEIYKARIEDRKKHGTSNAITVVESTIWTETTEQSYDRKVWLVNNFGECSILENFEDLEDYLRDFYEERKQEITSIIDKLRKNGGWKNYEESFHSLEIEKLYQNREYKPVAFFLTLDEAIRYTKYQKHNLNEPRLYTYNVGKSNHGKLPKVLELIERLGQEAEND